MAAFVSAVDRGSFAAAAAALGISAQMVAKHVVFLEDRLGTRLLHRTTRRQHLTAFGKIYYERCVEILGLAGDADDLAQATHATPRGLLRLSAPATFGVERLMPALADYMALYPAVKLDVALTDSLVDLAEDGFEAAIRIGTLPESSLIARPLMDYKLTICAAPIYLEKRGSPDRPADLPGHDCLAFTFSPRSEWRLEGPDGEIVVPIESRLQVDSAQGLRRAALAGMGIVMLPEIMLSDDIAAGRLIPLLAGYRPPVRPLSLIYLRDRRMSSKLRSFIDFVLERFAPQG